MASMTDPIHAASHSVLVPVDPSSSVSLFVMIFTPPPGKANGRTVVMLHGFPEFWGFWHPQVDALVDAGFQVVIPDQRGYNKSSMPPPTDNGDHYGIPRLAGDVIAMLDHLNLPKVTLVGHDFGGAVSWWTTMQFPQRIERLIILAMPHPLAFFNAWRDDPQQKADSIYIQYFLTKKMSPDLVKATAGGVLALSMRMSSKPNTFDDATLDAFRTAWLRKSDGTSFVPPGTLASAIAAANQQNNPSALFNQLNAAQALTAIGKMLWSGAAMMNWYNALLKTFIDFKDKPGFQWPSPNGVINVPVLVLEGDDDAFFQSSLLKKTMALCKAPGSGGKLLLGATHWMAWDATARTNRLLVAYAKDGTILTDPSLNMKDYTQT